MISDRNSARGTAARDSGGSPGASSLDPGTIRSGPELPGLLRGQALSIDGDSYVIRDQTGNEIALRIDRDTRLEGLISMGATVEAEVEVNGRVARLQRLEE